MSRVSINETTLTAIGDAIRGKTGKSDLIAPGDMPAEITGIVSGGGADPVIEELQITANGTYNAYDGVDGFAPVVVNVHQDGAPTAEELTLTGNMEMAFAYGRFDWMIEKYGNSITTNNIHTLKNMFKETDVERIPFELNFLPTVKDSSYCSLQQMFYGAKNLKEVPTMNNFNPSDLGSMFTSCESLRELPEDAFDTWDWSQIDNATSPYGASMGGIFTGCKSLRKLPVAIFEHGNPTATSSSYMGYYSIAQGCCALDELVNIPAPKNASKAVTANVTNYMVNKCHRLKEFTFVPGITLNWSNQLIDLSDQIGHINYDFSKGDILNNNSGITEDKKVNDDATYRALKNDPDWFAVGAAYSRYNKTSAINTINSLPTVNSGTIKFKGEAGSATDGGAINTLTEAEIAVATEKGWTVSFV